LSLPTHDTDGYADQHIIALRSLPLESATFKAQAIPAASEFAVLFSYPR